MDFITSASSVRNPFWSIRSPDPSTVSWESFAGKVPYGEELRKAEATRCRVAEDENDRDAILRHSKAWIVGVVAKATSLEKMLPTQRRLRFETSWWPVGCDSRDPSAAVTITCARWETVCLCVKEAIASSSDAYVAVFCHGDYSDALTTAARGLSAASRGLEEVLEWKNAPEGTGLWELDKTFMECLRDVCSSICHMCTMRVKGADLPFRVAASGWKAIHDLLSGMSCKSEPLMGTVCHLSRCCLAEAEYLESEAFKADGDYGSSVHHLKRVRGYAEKCLWDSMGWMSSIKKFTGDVPENIRFLDRAIENAEYIRIGLVQSIPGANSTESAQKSNSNSSPTKLPRISFMRYPDEYEMP